jgi:hypothetical protein
MQKSVTVAGALWLGLALSTPGFGQEQTGKQLLAQCQSPTPAACTATLHDMAAKLDNDPELCLPEEYDPEQLREAFIAWAKDNPDQLEQSALEAVRAAMTDAFPCEE